MNTEVVDYDIILPTVEETFEQGEEWVIVDFGDEKKKVRLKKRMSRTAFTIPQNISNL